MLHGSTLSIHAFLDLAVRMAEIIGELHRQGVIHRDLCSANFVVAGEKWVLPRSLPS